PAPTSPPPPSLHDALPISTPETRALQDDDNENPGFLWVQIGEDMWTKAEGAAGKSCASCHRAAASMRGVGAAYPKVNKDTGKLRSEEHTSELQSLTNLVCR